MTRSLEEIQALKAHKKNAVANAVAEMRNSLSNTN
jgi:hypothetical protein